MLTNGKCGYIFWWWSFSSEATQWWRERKGLRKLKDERTKKTTSKSTISWVEIFASKNTFLWSFSLFSLRTVHLVSEWFNFFIARMLHVINEKEKRGSSGDKSTKASQTMEKKRWNINTHKCVMLKCRHFILFLLWTWDENYRFFGEIAKLISLVWLFVSWTEKAPAWN